MISGLGREKKYLKIELVLSEKKASVNGGGYFDSASINIIAR